MGTLSGKVAVVTGASRGIGRAVAVRLGRMGADVAVNYSSDEASARSCVEAIRATGARALPVQANVAHVHEIEGMFGRTRRELGDIDIVVANAGMEVVDVATVDVTEEQFDRAFSINAKGTFFTLQQAGRNVRDGGRIIYLGSSSTQFPTPGHALYGSSKITGQFLVEVLAKELGARQVAVNSVLPTAITGAGVGAQGLRQSVLDYIDQYNPMKRAGTVDDVADVIEFLAGPGSGYVSGQHLMLAGGAPS